MSLKHVLVLLMSVLVIDVCWQVFSRYVLQDPSSFTDELARYLLIWLSLLGAAYVTGKDEHIAIDLLSKKMNSTANVILKNSLVLFFSLSVLVFGGIYLVTTMLALQQLSATLQIPMGYIYLVIPLSGFIMCYYSVANLISFFKEGRD